MLKAIFGAKGQLAVGFTALVLSSAAWVQGTVSIPEATTPPWNWSPEVFIFHASMLALVIGSFSIISSALGYRATERVEAVVAEVEHADEVHVDNGEGRDNEAKG